MKIPHVAAVILYAINSKGEVVKGILERSSEGAQDALENGDWREFKLLLRLFACLQGIFEGDGIFPILDELFNRAADQQTASPEDVSRLEVWTEEPSNFYTGRRLGTCQNYPPHPPIRHDFISY